ncbi:MAG TPA: histidine kinase [Anaerolineae bacterium]
MSEHHRPELAELPTNRVVAVALFLFYLATVGRTLASVQASAYLRSQLGLLVGLELAFLLLYSLTNFWGRFWRAGTPPSWLHLYFTIQSALVLFLYLSAPELDFLTNLFVLLSFQAALALRSRTRWIWITVFMALTIGLQIFSLGLWRGLGLGLVAMVSEMILAAYVTVNSDVTMAQARGRAMLLELQETHRQLERYAGQVEELAGIQERNRLAREIHDSVSQTLFSITLSTRAAQLLLEKNPSRVRSELEQLQDLVQSALAEMRSLIAELRQQPDQAPADPPLQSSQSGSSPLSPGPTA